MVSFGPNHILLQPSQGTPIKWYEPGDRARELLDQFPDVDGVLTYDVPFEWRASE